MSSCAATFEKADRRARRPSRSSPAFAFVNAEDIAKKVIARFEAGEFDVCTLFYSRFKSVISQIPTSQQIIPLVVGSAPPRMPARPPSYELRAGGRRKSSPGCLPAQSLAVQIFPRGFLEKQRLVLYGAQMSAME